ncbi:hypothetical protein E6O75_ATG00672 [Venturia nashicola]|uniref:Uncharacterized protein n=1 Tax=Venturia nashicola TaxID=86259 RepID=A0A4Z1PEH0_9PEZI|nr:hypothetical protein E6O75_ATG00672 [Venturia nashicola]
MRVYKHALTVNNRCCLHAILDRELITLRVELDSTTVKFLFTLSFSRRKHVAEWTEYLLMDGYICVLQWEKGNFPDGLKIDGWMDGWMVCGKFGNLRGLEWLSYTILYAGKMSDCKKSIWMMSE